jgi:hypothetical protein
MIVYTPLDLPRIEPDSWDIFWKIWNENAKPMFKKLKGGWEFDQPENSLWFGMDIYKATEKTHAWPAPYYDIRNELPQLYNLISNLPLNVERARLVESKASFIPHTDDDADIWVARAHFFNQLSHEQWFFTPPGGGDKIYMSCPEETNWFAFNDKNCWHGTDYIKDKPKILLQLYIKNMPDDLISNSIKKYKEYTISL